MKYILIFENFIKNFTKYWFEVRDPKDNKGYSVGFGVGEIKDDNISKFNRTDRHEQFKLFNEIKKYFKEWFLDVKPDKFYFSVPGEKRMNIYLRFLKDFLKDDFEYTINKTEYKPFDLSEKNVYYVLFTNKMQ